MKAVFIGRFQPFHNGHRHVVEEWRDRFDEFSIALGSPEKSRTIKNPLNAEERREIIHYCYPEVEIVEVEDEGRGEEGHKDWTERFLAETGADVVISGNGLVQKLVESYTDVEMVQIENVEPHKFSGREIRQRVREGKDWRHLVPNCSKDITKQYVSVIKDSN